MSVQSSNGQTHRIRMKQKSLPCCGLGKIFFLKEKNQTRAIIYAISMTDQSLTNLAINKQACQHFCKLCSNARSQNYDMK